LSDHPKIVPVILAGGHGTRLWPTSTPDLPKQFIVLKAGGTTFENSLLRVDNDAIFLKAIIICAEQNLLIVERLTRGQDTQIICEPLGCNTAPACCIGGFAAQELAGSSALMLIMPADHYIPDVKFFEESVQDAVFAAQSGKIVTFGIRPEFGCTEYGYIERGDEIGNSVYHVKSFTEKPRTRTAQSYFKSCQYFWNAGIFLVRADVLLSEMQNHQSDILIYAQEAWAESRSEGNHRFLPSEIFEKL
jgi:mannose-1-phosphate guanylyltransferase/mannose-6-phosphate isomerase